MTITDKDPAKVVLEKYPAGRNANGGRHLSHCRRCLVEDKCLVGRNVIVDYQESLNRSTCYCNAQETCSVGLMLMVIAC